MGCFYKWNLKKLFFYSNKKYVLKGAVTKPCHCVYYCKIVMVIPDDALKKRVYNVWIFDMLK